MRLDRLPQLHFGHIPLEDATGPFLNGKPAHVRAAYSIAVPVAVEREDIETFLAVCRPNRVAERDCRQRKMLHR